MGAGHPISTGPLRLPLNLSPREGLTVLMRRLDNSKADFPSKNFGAIDSLVTI